MSESAKAFNAAQPAAQNDVPLARRLQDVLDGQYAEVRNIARAFVARPEMAPPPADIPKEQYRELTLNRVRQLIDAGFTRMPYSVANGGENKGSAYINLGEILAHADMSLAVKQGVQFGLFGTSIERLGTEKHQHLVPEMYMGRLLGGFAMTEVGGGSDVQGLQTVATYDHATRSFTVDTPVEGARKTYIGNAALHGRMMVVFAQLKMDKDSESKGVHAFLVPVRDDKGAVLPGVTIGDNGHKVGLNGVDNGTIAFDKVKIPYDAMLDKLSSINEAGEYKSDVEKKSARFFKMIGTLVTGRVFVSMASLSGAKNALAAAVNFTDNRKVFGDKLLDKQSAQTRLMPKLAEAYALHFATRTLLEAFDKQKPETETMAAAIKSVASDRAMEAVDEGRKLAGGLGFMSQERYGVLRGDMDVFRTFEGDNTVLRMLVAKNQLGRLANKFKESSGIGKLFKGLAITFKSRQLADDAQTDDKQMFLDPEFQNSLFAGRERAMIYALSKKAVKLSKKYDKAQTANLLQDDMIAYSDAYAERLIVQEFTKIVAEQKDPQVKALLKDVADLYAVHALRRNALWYLENDHMEPEQTHALVRLEKDLSLKIRPQAQVLVDGFGIPAQLLSGAAPKPGTQPKPIAPRA